MRISYRWLTQLLPSLTLPPSEVAERLTLAGLAVDAVRPFGADSEALRVAEVQRLEPHPSRANLQLVTVGLGGRSQRVVCGANNVPAPGGLVVLAELGARLPGLPEPLAGRAIGGVTSEGMLCSELELGLAEASSGILILPPGSAALGSAFSSAFPEARDTILELDLTPNRPDALGHVGVARELAALLDLRFELPAPGAFKRTATGKPEDFVTLENRDFERCPDYGAAIVLDVRVAPSPLWLRFRLQSLGVRPISNVVDITNLILLEISRPMHAFDLDRIRDARIVIRRAEAREPFTTLDGVARRLDPDDLLICDGQGPSALGGIMGGLDSEIHAATQRVLLESAQFEPRAIRRTARRHGLHTEASHRFERGADARSIDWALRRAQSLLTELAGGAAVPSELHQRAPDAPPRRIPLRKNRLNALLGWELPLPEAQAVLSRLGFESRPGTEAESLEVHGASFRPDVQREIDLIEEVARVRGYDKIPLQLPAIPPQPFQDRSRLKRDVTHEAQNLGLSEAVTLAFVAERDLEVLSAPKPTVRLLNPLTEERTVLRKSLLPGLLEALRNARRHGETDLLLFSVGAVYLTPVARASQGGPRPRLPEDVGVLPHEHLSFAAVIAGNRYEHLNPTPEPRDIYDAKGYAQELVARLAQRTPSVLRMRSPLPYLHPRGAAELRVGEARVGSFGPLHPDVVEKLDLAGPALVIELDLEALEAVGKAIPSCEPIPRIPAVVRDLSLVVSQAVPAGDVEHALRQAAGELCESIALVGLFRGGSVPENHHSLTFRVVYRDPAAQRGQSDARTLTDAEVEAAQTQALSAVKSRYSAVLRG